MIKLIVCDFDGTILDRKTQSIGNKIAEALKKADEKGVQFACATGRNAPAASEILSKTGTKGWMIDLNGAELTSYEGECFYQNGLKRSIVEELLPCMLHPEVLTSFYCPGMKYTLLPLQEHYQRYFTVPACGKTPQTFSFEQFSATYTSVSDFSQIPDPIFKVEMRTGDLDVLDQIRTALSQNIQVDLTSAFTHNLEVMPAGCNKASTLHILAKKLGIKNEEIAVFGDDLNDLCLFEQFENSYAVANAKPEILKKAAHVIGNCESQEAAEVILSLIG